MPHNNTQQASQEAKHMKPEEVDFKQPFQFTVARTDECPPTVYSVDNFEDYEDITVEWEGGSITYSASSVKTFIKVGTWLVLKQPESTQGALFGKSFRFMCPPAEQVYVYKDGLYKIEGEDSWYNAGEALARSSVKHGGWVILPTVATQQHSSQSDEVSFTYAEQRVAEALSPAGKGVAEDSVQTTIQDIVQEWVGDNDGQHIYAQGNTVYFIHKQGKDVEVKYKYRNPNPTFAEAVAESREIGTKKQGLLDTIKNACTQSSGRIAVTVYDEGYDVYHRPMFECGIRVPEEDIVKFLDALAVIDSMENW